MQRDEGRISWPEQCVIDTLREHGPMTDSDIHKRVAATEEEMRATLKMLSRRGAIEKDDARRWRIKAP